MQIKVCFINYLFVHKCNTYQWTHVIDFNPLKREGRSIRERRLHAMEWWMNLFGSGSTTTDQYNVVVLLRAVLQLQSTDRKDHGYRAPLVHGTASFVQSVPRFELQILVRSFNAWQRGIKNFCKRFAKDLQKITKSLDQRNKTFALFKQFFWQRINEFFHVIFRVLIVKAL